MITAGLLTNVLFCIAVPVAFGIFGASLFCAVVLGRAYAASPPPRDVELLEWLRANQDN